MATKHKKPHFHFLPIVYLLFFMAGTFFIEMGLSAYQASVKTQSWTKTQGQLLDARYRTEYNPNLYTSGEGAYETFFHLIYTYTSVNYIFPMIAKVKKAITAIYHAIDSKYLPRYLAQFDIRIKM
ncbi:MAG: hypothetical protein KAJ63_00435 [Methyloprofundus sp.]|nr:hypothetical protein [Methyloprofundus sp.]